MVKNLRVRVLVENTVRGTQLLAEHGLSFWIEADGHRILMDTGRGEILAVNAERTKTPLDRADAVVLSHGHHDHSGGLAAVLGGKRRLPVYMHRGAMTKRYTRRKDDKARYIGVREAGRQLLKEREKDIVYTDRVTSIAEGVYATGEIPRKTSFEDTGGDFFLDEACSMRDPILDDQALYVDTPKGLVVLLGCAHSGVINTLAHISEATGGRKIHAVLGGMHLVRASEERLEATARAFDEYGLEVLGPSHCSGIKAAAFLWSRFPEQCVECHCGAEFEFGDEAS